MTEATYILYSEPCDCGSHIRHNNGGNYHARVRLHAFSDNDRWCVIIERTSTRESFPQDTYEVLVQNEMGFEIVDERVVDENDKVIRRFRYYEAEIIKEG